MSIDWHSGCRIRHSHRGLRRTSENPVAACSLNKVFEPPYTQTWSSEKEMYLDHSGRFLREDDFSNGNFPR